MGTLYTNADGLVEHFGTRDSENHRAGETAQKGFLKQAIVYITGANVEATQTGNKLAGGAVIPSGAHITKATLWVTTAFAGTNAALNIGTYGYDDLAAVDADGIDAAIAVTSLTDNAEIACDGAQVDTVLAEAVYVGVDYDTAAFTAGSARLVIEYFVE